MIKFDDITKESIKEHNPNWPQIQNIQNLDYWRLWLWKNKCIKSNKSPTRYQ